MSARPDRSLPDPWEETFIRTAARLRDAPGVELRVALAGAALVADLTHGEYNPYLWGLSVPVPRRLRPRRRRSS